MKRLRNVLLMGAVAVPLMSAACGSGSGVRKVTIDEGVCAGQVPLLTMKLGETNRVIVDNTKHSDQQTSMTLNLSSFPVLVKGEIPPNSQIGDRLSTIRITSSAGEQHSVDLQPTFTGNFSAECNMTLSKDVGVQIRQTVLKFQLVN